MTNFHRRTVLSVMTVLAMTIVAQAQDFTLTRPVDLIVGSSAGGGLDSNARALAQVMEKYAGQPINIINQTAGGGVVANTQTMNGTKDGRTLGLISIPALVDQFRVEGVPYNAKTFTYVGQVSEDQNVIIVNATGKYGNMSGAELIEHAKANPDTVSFGVSQALGHQDYVLMQIEKATGAKFNRIPIKGGAQILLSLLNGELDAAGIYPSEVLSQVQAGSLKPLLHAGPKQLDVMPDVPSFTSLGFPVEFLVFRSIVLPQDTPEDVAAFWRDVLEKTMSDPALKEIYQKAGVTYSYLPAAEAAEHAAKMEDVYRTLAEENDIKPAAAN